MPKNKKSKCLYFFKKPLAEFKLNIDPRFYKLSTRTFGLLKWLFEELERYINSGIKVDFNLIENVAQKVYGFSSVNRGNLREVFNIKDEYLSLESLNSIAAKYTINTIKREQKFSSVEDYLRNMNCHLSLNEILSELKQDGFTKDDVLIELNTNNQIHLDNEGRYYHSIEDKSIECSFHNIINIYKIVEDISLNDVIKIILNYKNEPMPTMEIIEELKIIGQFNNDDIEAILRNSNEFIEIEEDIWVPFEWRNYSIKNLIRNPKDIHQIMSIKGIGLDRFNSLIIYLNLSDSIHINNEGKYFYSSEDKSQECLIYNISDLIGVINDISLKDIIISIFNEVNTPMSLNELHEKISTIRDVSINEIYNVLENNEFKEIGYNKWVLSNWDRYKNFMFDFERTLNQIREVFSDREWECFIKYEIDPRRYTLEDIGQEIGVTRERVRQILIKTTNKLKHNTCKSKMQPYVEYINLIIKENRVISIDELGQDHQYNKVFGNQPIEYVITLLNYFGSNCYIIKGKYAACIPESFIINYLDQLASTLLDKQVKSLDIKMLVKMMGIECKLGKQVVLDFIKDDSRYATLKDGIKVIYSNSRINKPDMVLIALTNIGVPVHHSMIRKEFNRIFDEQMSARNILAILDREERFVRVYTGTYALKEWNCQRHVSIIDLGIDALDRYNKPLHYSKIYELIKDFTKAKDTTLYVFLNMDERVVGLGEGVYGLSKWINEPNCEEKFGFTREQIIIAKNMDRVLIGTSKNSYGHMVTKYRISDPTLKNGYIRLDKVLQDYVNERVDMYDFNGRIYHLTYRSYSGYLYRLTNFFREKEIAPGQILYFEFVAPNAMRILMEQEYEHNYIPFNYLIVPEEEQLDFKPETEEEEINIVDLDSLRQFGLKYGYVYNEDIEKVDITSEYQSITELMLDFMEMGIEFLDRCS